MISWPFFRPSFRLDLMGEQLADGMGPGTNRRKAAMGFILLAGGAEFDGQMAVVDRQAIALAGGTEVPIRIIPAAAAPDNNHQRAGQNGVNWFRSLGATNVAAVPLIDRSSADDPDVVRDLAQAGLIYLLGGFPRHLNQSLSGSRSWQSILNALANGAVVAGSSAGAMVLCEFFFDPAGSRVEKGLNLVPGACVLPHHNTFGRTWAAQLKKRLPDTVLIGIDEQTGCIGAEPEGPWRVYGQGQATRYSKDCTEEFGPTEAFFLFQAGSQPTL
jgi:cyanophycinase